MGKKHKDIFDKNFDDTLAVVVKKAFNMHQLDSVEQELFDAWFVKDERNREIFNFLGKDSKIEELSNLIDSDFTVRQYQAVQKKIAQREIVQSKTTQRDIIQKTLASKRFAKQIWYGAAASIAIILGLGINQNMIKVNRDAMLAQELTSVYMLDREGGEPIIIEGESVSFLPNLEKETGFTKLDSSVTISKISEAVKIKTVVVPRGKEVNIVLPDGSKVWLGANSTISFPEQFLGETREVSISGEAFLDVVNDGYSRFVATSANIKTKVYGTEFYITSSNEVNYTSVSLLTGSVEVESQTGVTVMLEPGERAMNIKGEGGFNLQNFDVNNLRAVKEGMFVFWGDKIKDIIPVLNNWYDFTIICDHEIENSIFYLKINKDTPVQEVIELISYTNRLGYKINKKTKTIKLTTSN